MNHTSNYNLSQWEKSDRVLMEDFNADNAKLDAALTAQAEALAKCGNCSIGVFTYTGTGTYGSNNPTRITFPKMPAYLIITGSAMAIGRGGAGAVTLVYAFNGYTHIGGKGVSWSGNTLLISDTSDPGKQMNASETYTVIGFYAENKE